MRDFDRELNNKLDQSFVRQAHTVADMAAARGGIVKEHLHGFSLVAFPFGHNSEIILVGGSVNQALLDGQLRRKRIFLLLSLIALAIVLTCAYFTAGFLLAPISRLKQALDQISDGDFSQKLFSSRKDELGNLTSDFASMARGLEERKRLASLLSDHAVESLSATGSNSSANSFHELSGVAMVSDIREFTTLCEKHETAAITGMLDDHFAAMSAIITRNGGQIYKFIGDAVEAVFVGNDPQKCSLNAIKAATEMYGALQHLNQKRQKNGLFTYRFGVGLAYGNFLAGLLVTRKQGWTMQSSGMPLIGSRT